jgi:sugar lactone lactonase YvrE
MANAPTMAVIISKRTIWFLCSAVALASAAVAETGLFQSRQLTPSGEYTFNIEGPAVDRAGNLYVVNFQRPGTIGKVAAGGAASELFATLPEGSVGNAIRFDASGRMFIADYKKHNVFVIEPGTTESRSYFQSDDFNQPNDLTVAADGTLYASDPNWKARNGQIWRITRGADGNGVGEKMTSPRPMSTTNGIDLSPDGRTLYVGESNSNEIWAYRLEGNALTAPRLVRKFSDASIDGLRTDIDDRILVARILKGTILVLRPDGSVEREIPLTAKEPTNLAFGGVDGKTVYVSQRKGGFVETFRVARPGREYCLQAGCLK